MMTNQLLWFMADYAVPASLFLLMGIVGTAIGGIDLKLLGNSFWRIFLGASFQLLLLPVLALVIIALLSPPPIIATSLLLLSLCPGGGISSYYCYVGRVNVLLSTVVTIVSTIVSFLTIPIWLNILAQTVGIATASKPAPIAHITIQLFILILIPMVLGFAVRRLRPALIESMRPYLDGFANFLIATLVATVLWSAHEQVIGLATSIGLVACSLIFGAMVLGYLQTWAMRPIDRPVFVIEFGTRNTGVALFLSIALLDRADFPGFAGFMAGYFLLEVIVMLTYASFLSRRVD